MKICPIRTKFFHVYGWTDMIKLTVPFHNFSNVPRNFSFQGQCRQENSKEAHICDTTGEHLLEVSSSYKELHSIP